MSEQFQKHMNTEIEQVQQKVNQGRESRYRSSRRTRVLALVYLVQFVLVQFVLFATLAWFVHVNPVIPIDVAITRGFQENKAPWLQAFMVAVSFLGNQFLLFTALIIFIAAVFWLVKLRLEALLVLILSGVSSLTNFLLKLLVSRPRPSARLVDIFQQAKGQSFPSEHVMSYVAFWGLLFSLGLILFNRKRWWHYALLIIPALFVILVGPSRIYLGDHWASDVLGGYLFGSMLLGIALLIYLHIKSKEAHKRAFEKEQR